MSEFFDKVIEEYEKGQSNTTTQESDSKQSSTDTIVQHDFGKPSQDNPGVKIITIIMLLLYDIQNSKFQLWHISKSADELHTKEIRPHIMII